MGETFLISQGKIQTLGSYVHNVPCNRSDLRDTSRNRFSAFLQAIRDFCSSVRPFASSILDWAARLLCCFCSLSPFCIGPSSITTSAGEKGRRKPGRGSVPPARRPPIKRVMDQISGGGGCVATESACCQMRSEQSLCSAPKSRQSPRGELRFRISYT